MRRMRARLKQLVRDERGATAVLVVFLLIPMLGFGALALDISAQHADRTQLQNGADAAALAIAKACAEDEASCSAAAGGIGADFVAGNGGIPVDGTAEESTPNLAANEVTVVAMAEFPHFLASVIDGDDSTTIRAQGTAEWGTPIAGNTLALAIDYCHFSESWPFPEETSAGETILLRYDEVASRGEQCSSSAGGFGWLESETCETYMTIGEDLNVRVEGDPGGSPVGSGCEDVLGTRLGQVVLVPVYDRVEGGGHVQHIVRAFAALRLTGYKISGGRPEGDLPASACNGNCRGIYGEFVEWVEIGDDLELGDCPPTVDCDAQTTVVRLIR